MPAKEPDKNKPSEEPSITSKQLGKDDTLLKRYHDFRGELPLFIVQELLHEREYGANLEDEQTQSNLFPKIAKLAIEKYGGSHEFGTEQSVVRRVKRDFERLKGNSYDVPQALKTHRWRKSPTVHFRR
jgi:hypothetical protein